jgi:protein-disulfide isomerase
VKTGRVRYVFRDLPLVQIHPHAFKAAEAANCAGEQGKFWEMHVRLFENTRALAPANLTQHAQAEGLDAAKFSQCLESGRQAAEVRKDMADAAAAGVGGTPGFVVGIVNPRNARDPNVRIFRSFTGAQPYATFKAVLDAALAEAEKQ